jgi:tetratricopeptide (TPR) repeat protein
MRPSEIETLVRSKVRPDRERCITLLKNHLQQTQDDAKSWYDLACCYDFLGRESEAEPNYKRVFELGIYKLPSKEQMGFYVGYGSTLRNNKKFEESKKILNEGIANFPNYIPLKVFLGFTLYSIGEHQEANQVLLGIAGQLPTEIMDGYERAARWYSENLDKPQ